MAALFKSNFLTRLLHWEYWPMEVIYFPVSFYYFWCSLRSGSFFFFSAANPGIENGGMLADSKYRILMSMPPDLIPETIFVPQNSKASSILKRIDRSGIQLPFIVKPDIGERGLKVEKISTLEEWEAYHQSANFDYLIQEFIEAETEAGVFYYRIPHEDRGQISSVVLKSMLTVRGDGKSSIRELVEAQPRAKLQEEVLSQKDPSRMKEIPDEGELVELVPIGNHSRGTTFLDGNHLINKELNERFDQLSKSIHGFYYGRFDIRCKSIEDLAAGGDFSILELNGAKSEPAHIYQPGYPLLKGYQSIFHHWKVMYRICRINHKAGFSYPEFNYCWKTYWEYVAYLKSVRVS